MSDGIKTVIWVGSARKDLKRFPRAVQRDIGQALYAAQCGETYPSVKPLKGFSGCAVLEVVTDYDTDTYRAVYTVRFADVLYVLHAFQKKSKRGKATPQKDMDLIRKRLKDAEDMHKQRQN